MRDSLYKQVLVKYHYIPATQVATLMKQYQDYLHKDSSCSFQQFLLNTGILTEDQDREISEKVDREEASITTEHAPPAVDGLEKQGIQKLSHYAIIGRLGAGGMGIVYQAKDIKTGELIALKVLQSPNHSDPDLVRRFLKEGELSSQIQHPNIVGVREFGVANNIHYLAMELIQGKSLAEYKPKSIQECVSVVSQIAQALSVLHKRGIIHRDIKTDNILMDMKNPTKPVPKLTDFSLAFRENPLETRITKTGAALGTPYYMSPEQAMGNKARIDHRTDIYSLGVVLYELLTQQYPFTAKTLHELYSKIMSENPIPPSHLRRGIKKELDQIVLKAISKEPEDRYQNCEDFERDLRCYIRGRRDLTTRRESLLAQLRRKGWLKKNNLIFAGMGFLLLLCLITIISLLASDKQIAEPPVKNSPQETANNQNTKVNNQNSPNNPHSQPNNQNIQANQGNINSQQNNTPHPTTNHQPINNPPINRVLPVEPSTLPNVADKDFAKIEKNLENASVWTIYQHLYMDFNAKIFWKLVKILENTSSNQFIVASKNPQAQLDPLFQSISYLYQQEFLLAWQSIEKLEKDEKDIKQSAGILFYFRGQIRAIMGDWDRALDDLRKAYKILPNPQNLDDGTLFYYLGSYWYQEWYHHFYELRIKHNPNQILFLCLAKYFLAQRNVAPEDNLSLLQELAEIAQIPAGYLHLARFLGKQGKSQESLKWLDKANKVNIPEFLILYYYHSQVEKNPLFSLKKIVQLEPKFLPAYFPLVMALDEKNQDQELIQYAKTAINIQAEPNLDMHTVLAKTLPAVGKIPEALQLIDDSIELFYQHGRFNMKINSASIINLYLFQTLIFEKIKMFDRTRIAYQHLLDVVPERERTYIDYCTFCKKNGLEMQLLEDLDWLVPKLLYENKFTSKIKLELDYIKKTVLEKLSAKVTETSDTASLAKLYAQIAWVHYLLKNQEESTNFFTKSYTITPTSEYHYYMGQIAFHNPGIKLQESLDHFQKAQDLNPRFHQNNLALLSNYAQAIIENLSPEIFQAMVITIEKMISHYPQYERHDVFSNYIVMILAKFSPLVKKHPYIGKEITRICEKSIAFNKSGRRTGALLLYCLAADMQPFEYNDKAAEYYKKAIMWNPYFPLTVFYHARFLKIIGKKKEALAGYRFGTFLAESAKLEVGNDLIQEMIALEKELAKKQ